MEHNDWSNTQLAQLTQRLIDEQAGIYRQYQTITEEFANDRGLTPDILENTGFERDETTRVWRRELDSLIIQPNLTSNNNIMLQDWLQAEFKGKVFCNVINSQERKPFINDFGINVMEIANYNYFPAYMPQELKTWQRNQEMVGRDFVDHTIKIKLPGRKNNIVLETRTRLFDLRTGNITKIKLIYPEKLEIIQRGLDVEMKSLPIAAIYDNVVWMFWDINYRSTGEIAVMKHVIDEALKLMKDKYKLQPTEDHEKRRFKQIINQFSRERQEQIDRQIEEVNRDKTIGLRNFVEASKREETIVKEKALLNNQQNFLDRKADSAIDYFRKCKKIKSWTPSGTAQIEFHLENLEMEHKNIKIKLPEMKVIINVVEGDFHVFATNDKDTERFNPIHPHVFRDGHVCMGNFSTIYPRLIAAGQFNQIADLLIQFLENYNEASPVIHFWKYKAMLEKGKRWNQLSDAERTKAYQDWLKHINEENTPELEDRLHEDVTG